MLSRAWLLGVVLAGLGGGCVNGPMTTLSLVPSSPFSKPKLPTQPDLPPGSAEEAIRVATTGAKVVTANLRLAFRPSFQWLGLPTVAIFHRDDIVFVTEGLSRQCPAEAELSAVLCMELAKMTAERAAMQQFEPHSANDPLLPPDVPIGSDYHGPNGFDDNVHLTVVAKYDSEMRQRQTPAVNPAHLARIYLQKAGFPPAILDDVEPVLRQASAADPSLERQLNPRGQGSGVRRQEDRLP